VAKTATVSLHSNTFEVDSALVGSKVEVVFDPFYLTTVEIRYRDRSMGQGVPVVIGRHTHPAARPEAAPEPAPPWDGHTGTTDCVDGDGWVTELRSVGRGDRCSGPPGGSATESRGGTESGCDESDRGCTEG
jgi:hypothetical protein